MDYEQYEMLLAACIRGELGNAQQILRDNPNINIMLEDIFCLTCCWGHLHILQWINSVKPDITITANIEGYKSFEFACINGHLNVTQWLFQTNPNINISANNNQAFIWSCGNGHLEVSKWLLEMKPDLINYISSQHESAFRWACSSGHLNVVQWLFQLKPTINICAEGHFAFKQACIRVRLNVAEWLKSLKPNLYVINYNENGTYKGYYIRTKEEEKWQCKKYMVWLRCNDSPNKTSIVYKLPTDVSRYMIGFV